MSATNHRQIYRMADVEVDATRACLRRDGQEQHLRRQTFQVLLYLIEHQGRGVTKDELINEVWKGTAVTDDALVQCIVDIRRALGDNSRHPRFVKTIPKVGYSFIAPVTEDIGDSSLTVQTEEITSIKLEYEEETDDFAEAAVNPLIELPAPALRLRDRRKIVLASALALFSILAVATAIYWNSKGADSSNKQTAITVPQMAGRRALAVMYFENQSGDQEMNWLREGLADMLITDLSRSAKLSVLGRLQLQQLLERIGHDPASNIRLDEALEMAREVHAEVVALGSFARIDEEVRVNVELYDTRSGALLAAENITASQPSQILTQIDLLSMKLAAHLGEAPGEDYSQSGLAHAMTDNLEAYRYYSLAIEKAQGLHSAEAIALLEKAIALDPQFAMAHARIGYAYAVAWAFPGKAKPYLEKAFRLSDRLTEMDRLYIFGWYSIANLDFAGAIKSFQEITTKYPLEIEAYVTLSRLLEGEGQLEEAAEVIKRALVIDAGAKDLYNALGSIYSELGRHDEAIAMLQRYVQLAPDEANAHDSLALGYQWAGRYAEAISEYERALALNPNFEIAIIHLGNTYFQQGRYQDAIEQYNRYTETAPSDFERARGFAVISFVRLKKGELDEAERMAKKSLSYDKQFVWPSFFIALERNDVARASKLLEQLSTEWPYINRGARPNTRPFICLRGRLKLKSGRAAEAIEDFKEALRQRPDIWDIDSFEDCLANAYLELGRFDEAIAEYERILRLNPNYPLAHYHLAQAYERLGEAEQARNEMERFLQTWEMADADLPEMQTARTKLNL